MSATQISSAAAPATAGSRPPPTPATSDSLGQGCFVEEVEVRGHIIDSLILPKILDRITAGGGSFRIKEIRVGQAATDPSYALIEVGAAEESSLQRILAQLADHGAVPTTLQDCRTVAADMAGTFPEEFYSTTNQRTEVRLSGHWVPVRDQRMDCGIVIDPEPRDSVGIGGPALLPSGHLLLPFGAGRGDLLSARF